MQTTEERISIRLTKEDIRILNLLIKMLGESKSQVIRRAINELFKDRLIKGN